jgi:tetratricopeptide (TPR) repeat protein
LALTNRADYSQENYQEAEVWATRAVELDPEFAQAWAMLVELHGQAVWIGYDTSPERYAAALEARDNARRLAPEAAETIAAEAEYAYRIEQDFPKAVALFQQAHRALPGDVDILHRLALAQRRTPDLDGALDSFRRTLELDPNHARTTTTMSATLLSMGRLEEAERLIEQWMVTYPDARDLRAERVNAYLDRGEVELARNVIDSMTPWVSAAYFTAVVEAPFLERDYRQAIEIWDSPAVAAMAENRGTVGWRETSRAQAYRLLGQMEDARAQARRAIELIEAAPPTGSYSDAFELLIKSYALLVLDRHDEALSAAEQARRDLPESRDLLFGSLVSSWRTRVLARAGHREQALAEIERLLEAPYRMNKWRLYLDPRWDFFRDDPRFNEMIRPDGVEQSGP